MPIPKNLEALLAVMSPADAKAQRAIWEANETIAEQVDKFFVPQAEFSRQLNAKDVELKKARDSEQAMRDWEKRERPKAEKAYADVVALEKERNELREKVERAAIRTEEITGGEVDSEKLMANVLKQLDGRTVSPDRMNELIAAESAKIVTSVDERIGEAREKLFKETVPAIAKWTTRMAQAMMRHQQEFGKELNDEEFVTFMQENNIQDPAVGYQKYTEPAKRERDIKAEVDRQVASELAKRSIPGVSSGESGERNWLELKVAGEQGPVKYAENSELGDRSTAMAAAKELREEGHF